jgi:hypothetical protein
MPVRAGVPGLGSARAEGSDPKWLGLIRDVDVEVER